MGVQGVYKRMPTISVRFITSTDTFTLQTNTAENASDASVLTDGSLVEQVISFNTENDMSNDTPVFSLVLAGLDRWDRILQPNDIVTIRVNPGDGNTVVNDVIMVGMISEVKKLGSYGESSIVYQISGQSMAKALMQLKLGTLQEIASITQSFGWMSAMGTEDQSGNEVVKGKHLQPKYTKSFGVKAIKVKSGMYKDVEGKSIKGDSDTIALVDKSTGIKNNTWISVAGYGDVKARVMANTTMLEDTTFGTKKEIYIDVSSKSSRDSYNKKYASKKAKVKVYNSKKSPDQYYKDSKKSNGSVQADSSGLMFTGKTAADVVENIIRWFMNLSGDDLLLTSSLDNTDIHYTFNGDRKNFGDWVELNLSSREEDEMLLDALPLMSFTGSLRQMITQAQAKPYNEFYVDFTSDEKAVFNMRPTPFEPDDWNPLQSNAIRLESYNIIEESLSHNDNEVYSVFSSSIPNSITLNTVSDLMMYPVYFPGLTQRYGYSMLEQQNDYIFRSKENQKTKGGSDSSGGSLDMASGDTKTNAKNIASALKKAGASGQGIAALLGTMQGESQLIPSTIQGGGSYDRETAYSNAGGYGFGLAQWDATRRVGLLKYADDNNKKWDNLGLQVSYLLSGDTSSSMIKEFLVRTDSIESIVSDMVSRWEVPADPAGETAKRIPMAKAWYSELSLSNVKGEGKIDVTKIGKGKTLTQALGLKDNSNKTLTEAMGKSSNPYPSFAEVVQKQYDASKSKADKKKKKAAKIDDDNLNLAKKYSVYLANWYGNNNSFISGEIRVVGNPDYRVGNVLLRYDPAVAEWNSREYVYYIESVSHEFSYTGGYTTTLGVTRGLPGGINRFSTWNTSESDLTAEKPGNGGLQFFNGGLFGELSIAEAADKGFKEADNDSSSDSDSDSGSESSSGSGDDYPSKWRDAVQDSTEDDWLYYNRECVSFVAWRLSQKSKFSGKKPTEVPFYRLGNAWDWNAVEAKYHKSTPKAGDVALFAPGVWGAGAVGHVAYVAKVSGDDIFIEDYNYGQPMGQYHTHTIPASTPTTFLRF